MRFISVFIFTVFQLSFLLSSMPVVASDLSARLLDVARDSHLAEQTINTLQGQPPHQLTTADYLVIAQAYQTLGNREAALDATQKAESVAQTPYLLALSLFKKAQIYGIYYQNAELAIQQLLQAEQHLTALEEPAAKILLTDVLSSFASAYNLQGDLKTALTYAQRSLALAQKINNDARQLHALILNGRITLQNNQYQLAFSYLQQALLLASQLQDEEELASIHFRLGMAHRKLEQHTDALEHFTAAAERYSALNRMANYSAVLVYMAESYLEEPRQIEKAEALLQEAIDIAKAQQNISRTATAYYSLGRVAMLRQDYRLSEENYQKALQGFRQINSRGMATETALALVQLMIEQKRYDEAAAFNTAVSTDIDAAATFLKIRYFTNAAMLAAAAGDWQTAYQFQTVITELNQQELTSQIKDNMLALKDGLSQVSETEQQDTVTSELQAALQTAQSRQVLLQAALVFMFFFSFIIWQLYRRKVSITVPSVQETTPKQWQQFQDKVKVLSTQQDMTLWVLTPRNYGLLSRQFGHNVLAKHIKALEHKLDTSAFKAIFIDNDMLWLALPTAQTTEQATSLDSVIHLLQQQLTQFEIEAAILTAELPLQELLGNNWHKDDITALQDAIGYAWYLTEQQSPESMQWHLRFSALHPRPCEWQAEDLRSDMLNALRLTELIIYVNEHPLAITD